MHVNCYLLLLMSPPQLQSWLPEEDILVNSSMTCSPAFNIAMGVGKISTRYFLQNAKCVKTFVRDCSVFLRHALITKLNQNPSILWILRLATQRLLRDLDSKKEAL